MTATNIKSWSSTAASNNSASPNGFPEGMAPSGVNDAARQVMAEVRRWYEDPAWFDLGYTYAYVSGTSFKVAGLDKTADFVVGRRVRAVGTSTGTIYGVIATSAFSTDTTVTVTWDSGTLSNETLAVSIGLPTLGKPIPYASLGLTGAVVMADLANLAQGSVIGRASGAGTGVPSAQTFATVYAGIFASVNTFTAAQIGTPVALTSSSNSIAINLALANNFSYTFTENTTLANPSNPVAGQSGCIFLTQHASSPKTLAFGSQYKWANGAAGTISATNSALDTLYYNVRDTTHIELSLAKANA